MIVKILNSSSSDFHGVKYNDEKVEKGTGELMVMKNFPTFINERSSQEDVRNYLKSVSKSEKVKNPQFHCVISTKFQDHSKEELTTVAENFLDEMGYGKQPFIVVFHNDTENNHIHIVSTRVDKKSGKKINDSYERLKAQKSLSNTLEKLFGLKTEEHLSKLLNYRFGSLKQLEILLTGNGYKMVKNKQNENAFDILKNGVIQMTIDGTQIKFENIKSNNRTKQINAILNKYKEIYSNKVFKVEDNRAKLGVKPASESAEKKELKPKIEFASELQEKLKQMFGLDLVFNQKDERDPFGFTVIDNKTGCIYKGSDIIKMNDLFEFTSETIDKKTFEILKDFTIPNKESKKIFLDFFNKSRSDSKVSGFMVFENKGRKNLETYQEIQNDVREFIREKNSNNDTISILKADDGRLYAIHNKYHFVSDLEKLIGEKEYQQILTPSSEQFETGVQVVKNGKNGLQQAVNEMIFEFMKSTGTAKDPAEKELKKRKKRRK